MARMNCDHCGETFHEDNMNECVNCRADVCPYCGQIASLPDRQPREFWCDICLEKARAASTPQA
jgi:NAD-dependent SIR2 family protein deacetylase